MQRAAQRAAQRVRAAQQHRPEGALACIRARCRFRCRFPESASRPEALRPSPFPRAAHPRARQRSRPFQRDPAPRPRRGRARTLPLDSDFWKMPSTGGQVPTVMVAPACASRGSGKRERQLDVPSSSDGVRWRGARRARRARARQKELAHGDGTPQRAPCRSPSRNQSNRPHPR